MPTRTPTAKSPAQSGAKTKTASNLIRENSRETLEMRFDAFLETADPYEIKLLESILSTWHSGICSPVDGVDEIPLAEAFEFELGRGETYIRVPRKLLGGIKGHILACGAVDPSACVGALAGKSYASTPNVQFQDNDEQNATAIIQAREVYRLCPEAILTHDKDFEDGLRRLAGE